ncbi:MAG: hypothetical protein GX238_03915 [Epulopiscium sp.]|nr:hypothetical protein [Candidatus Epulonipiscium sp.]
MIGELSFGPDGLLWGILWDEQKDGKEGFGLFICLGSINQSNYKKSCI